MTPLNKFGLRSSLAIALVTVLGAGYALPTGAQNLDLTAKNDGRDPISSSPTNRGRVAKAAAGAVAPEIKDIYRIGVEDELQISVWREPELSNTVVVRPDGMITIPLLNDVQVVGLQTEELQALLTDKLKPFVNEPQVTVIVRQIRSRHVYVFGQVAHQGTFQLNSRKTLLEVLAEAGGLSQFAKAGSMYVLRTDGGKQVRIPINYKKVVSGQSQNLLLYPGDVVVVP